MNGEMTVLELHDVATTVFCRSCDRLKDKVSALRLQMKQLQAENDRLRQLVNLNHKDPSREFNTFWYIIQILCIVAAF